MGLEAKCAVVRRSARSGGDAVRAAQATALWEGDALIIRGDARARISRDEIKAVDVRDDRLVVSYVDGTVELTLGATTAEKWRTRMLAQPKSRLEKLGISANTRVVLVGFDDGESSVALRTELSDAGAIVHSGPCNKDDEIVILTVDGSAHLSRIASAAKRLPDSAALWVLHPKGKPEVADTRIFEAAKLAGLTYTKVASFSPTHTAEKLVRPVANRVTTKAKARPRAK